MTNLCDRNINFQIQIYILKTQIKLTSFFIKYKDSLM
jgi:hypothetical protein